MKVNIKKDLRLIAKEQYPNSVELQLVFMRGVNYGMDVANEIMKVKRK